MIRAKNKINIGVVGFGTIGSSVVKLLLERKKLFRDRSGIDLNLMLVCDKDLKSNRGVRISKSMLTKDVNKILRHPDIDVVVELIGGVHPAKEIVMRALGEGKHVVTANKLLLASEGEAIFKKAKETDREIFFEASVAGGVPIIKSIREGLLANTFYTVMGVLNGTSNYILSKMSEEGVDFKVALKEAQIKGYAEANSSLDISGIDSANKLAILSLLAFGKKVNMSDIYVEGIERISPIDIQYAKDWGYAVKLLAIAKRDKNQLALRVHPTLLPSQYLLSSVSGAYNAIFIDASLVGKQVYYGMGAGKLPTASAVLSDIMDMAAAIIYGKKSSRLIAPKRASIRKIKKMDDVMTRYYVHFSAVDEPCVLAKIADLLGKHNISIASVVQKERKEAHVVPIVMLTHEAREKDMQIALRKINRLAAIKRKSVLLRLEN